MVLRLGAALMLAAASPAALRGVQAAAGGAPARPVDAAHPKHLVMVVIDDLGFDDMGYAYTYIFSTSSSKMPFSLCLCTVIWSRDEPACWSGRYANGGQIATPNFNEMHDRGIALTQYYVQPSCSPTRATLMTGRKPVHTGINFWIPNAAYGLPLNETTLAQVMNARGFKSHAVGKVRVASAD